MCHVSALDPNLLRPDRKCRSPRRASGVFEHLPVQMVPISKDADIYKIFYLIMIVCSGTPFESVATDSVRAFAGVVEYVLWCEA